QPLNEYMRIRVRGEVTKDNWKRVIGFLANRARDAGWEEFKVDVQFENNRKRTVKIDRNNAAKEVLFIKSEEIKLKKPLVNCAIKVSREVVEESLKLLVP